MTTNKTSSRSISRSLLSSCLMVVLLFWSYTSWGATKTWDGSSSNNWDTDNNWTPSGVPNSGDDVVINIDADILVNNSSPTIKSLTINNNATVSFTSSGGGRTININNNSSSIAAGSTLTLRGSTGSGTRSMTLAFAGGGTRTMSIAGSLILTAVGEGTIYNASNSNTTVTGLLKNDGAGGGTNGTITSSASNLTISAGGTYEHALDGGTIPTATWNATSNCKITGLTGNDPNGDGQAFGNLIYDCSGMSGNRDMAGSGQSIAGNLEVLNTGSGILRINQTPLTIGGNCIISDDFRIGSNTARTLNITGDFTLNGGTLYMSTGNQIGTLSVTGDFAATGGTLTETSSGSGLIIFPSGTHTYTSGSNVSNTINHTINSGSTVEILAGSTMRNGSGCTLTNNGTIKGNGTIDNAGTFTPSATSFFAPGASPGTLSVTGPLGMGSMTYSCEIDGAAPDNDVIAVSGAATLTNAKLVVNWLTNPTVSGVYTVMTFASRTGTFATFTIPTVSGFTLMPVYTATSVQIMATVLPVELVSFTAKKTDKSVQLDWQTATEQNNEKFVVEHSTNALDYKPIAEVRGAGTTQLPQSYTFTDEKPLSGINYYRLRQLDYNGAESFSPVVSVDFGKSGRITIAPSPAIDRVRILLEEAYKTDARWNIFDSAGREVLSGTLEAESAEYELDVNALPEGMYTFRLVAGASVQVKQFRKM